MNILGTFSNNIKYQYCFTAHRNSRKKRSNSPVNCTNCSFEERNDVSVIGTDDERLGS